MSTQAPETRRRANKEVREAPERAQLWPPPEGTWVALAGLLPIFAAHYFYAALYSETAFSLVMAEAVVLGVLLTRGASRRDLVRMRGLTAPAMLFGLVILVGVVQLTPWAPGGPHPVWAYVGYGPGSTTIDRSSTVAELIKLMGLACIFLVGALTGASDRRARAAVNVTLGLGLILALWAFFGSVTGSLYQSSDRRLEGHFLNANTAGTFMACLLVLSLAVLFRQLRTGSRQDRVVRAAPVGAFALTFAICLLMTASRGAAGALIAALIAFGGLHLFSAKVKISRVLLIGLATLVVGAVVIFIAGDLVIDRFSRTDRDTVLRTAVWAEHWQAFLRSPLLGYGLGSSETVNQTLINSANYSTLWNIKAILNVYLQWLEQAGLVGAIAMFGCIGSILVTTTWRALARSRMTLILFGLISVDVVFLAHGATDFALDAFSMAAMWSYFLGLQLALSQGSSR
ncbi:O-antigen ligase family protein [Phenylobacterium sp.]|uniref:O-antigen ligase family protein n=1 Tax=Phenylobacterium sp. TaxID=1871053 RepID=UPI0030F4726A